MDSTYEGLKPLAPEEWDWEWIGLDSTYEGLKQELLIYRGVGYRGLDSTYEGLKRGGVGGASSVGRAFGQYL